MEFITLFGTPKKKEPTVYEKIRAAVKQTKENFTEQIQDLVEGEKEIDADMLEHLEAIMIGADIGVSDHERHSESDQRSDVEKNASGSERITRRHQG